MKKLKVVVYAISKNEEKFVKRFVSSMKEADDIYVLDTGSSDQTVSLLEKEGVHVSSKVIDPWRFDEARNASLSLVPEDVDICVCTDLDEVFESGWREKLEKIWQEKKINRLRYLYHWRFDENGRATTTFHINKIHSRHGFVWKHPVHEVLVPLFTLQKEYQTDEIVLNHYPDVFKSRSSYLPLLELSIQEDPEDDRNMHYLGREYMFYGRWQEAIATLHRHLKLKSATWKDERCASMRFMARSYAHLGFLEEAFYWYEKAIKEAPYLREGYVELAYLCYYEQRYFDVYFYLKQALLISKPSDSYINEDFAWNEKVYDLLSFAAFQLGFYDESYLYAKEALVRLPNDERLQKNVEEISKYVQIM